MDALDQFMADLEVKLILLDAKGFRRQGEWLHGDPNWVRRDPWGRFSSIFGSDDDDDKPKGKRPNAALRRVQKEATSAYSVKLVGGYYTRAEGTEVNDTGNVEVSGRVFDADGKEVGNFVRTIGYDPNYKNDDGTPMLLATHDEMMFTDAVQQQGLASVFNESMAMWYDSLGVDAIRLHAGDTTGGYAWARAGYQFDFQSSYYTGTGDIAINMDTMIAELKAGKHKHLQSPERDVPLKDFEVDALISGLMSDRERLDRMTPQEIASFGSVGSAYHWSEWVRGSDGELVEVDMWPGKDLLLGSNWSGIDKDYVEHSTTASQLALARRAAKQTEGFSYDPVTGQSPESGYMVSLPGHTKAFPYTPGDKESRQALVNNLADFVEENEAVLQDKSFYIGGWFNEDDGKFYLDISERVEDRYEAEALGAERNQIAIWDVVEADDIPTGGTGQPGPDFSTLKDLPLDLFSEYDSEGYWGDEGAAGSQSMLAHLSVASAWDVPGQVRAETKAKLAEDLRRRIRQQPDWEEAVQPWVMGRDNQEILERWTDLAGVNPDGLYWASKAAARRELVAQFREEVGEDKLRAAGYFGTEGDELFPGFDADGVAERTMRWQDQTGEDYEWDYDDPQYDDFRTAVESGAEATSVINDVDLTGDVQEELYELRDEIAAWHEAAGRDDEAERIRDIDLDTPEVGPFSERELKMMSYASDYPTTEEDVALARAVKETVDGWAATATASPAAVELQDSARAWITKKFGIDPNSMSHHYGTSSSSRVDERTTHQDFHDLFLDATYAATQDMLDRHDVGETVALYRGFHVKEDDWTEDDYKGSEATLLKTNPLSSWAVSPHIATIFANGATGDKSYGDFAVVAKAEVPREQILSTSVTGLGALIEGEVVLAGAPKWALLKWGQGEISVPEFD